MKIQANGIAIEFEDRGSKEGEPLILVMGLGMQLTGWPDEFVQVLVDQGFRVIRFDNRDAGLSQGFDHLGVPNVGVEAARWMMGLRVRAPYALADMAADVLGLMDALGIARAHVCGASMGGMIAQHLAAAAPARIKSLTLMMTSSGCRRLPQPRAQLQWLMMQEPRGDDPAAVARYLERLYAAIGSPSYKPAPAWLRQRLMQRIRRAWRPAGTARQLTALVADGDRSPMLSRLTLPVRVIHGEVDPLIPVAAASDLLRKIRGARADIVPGMGHDLPLPLLPRFAQSVAQVAADAR